MRTGPRLRRSALAATAAALARALASLPAATAAAVASLPSPALAGLGVAAAAPVLAALGVTAAPAPASAQERAPRAEAPGPEPGWIGISFDVVTTGYAGGASRTTVVVANTDRGSPADDAGILPGDVLLAINDLVGPQALAELPERLQIRAGDEVRVLIERDGQRREVRVRAAAMPAYRVAARGLTLTIEPDSVVASIARAMDSLRSRLTAVGGTRTVVRQRGWTPEQPEQGRLAPVGDAWMRGAPLHLFVFPDERYDSLRRETARLDGALAELYTRARMLEGGLPMGTAGSASSGDAGEELRRVRAAIEQVGRQAATVRRSMAETAGANDAFEYMFRYSEPEGEAPHANAFRPLTPYLLGRNRVAGAEVVDLRPELAAYFRVEGGVLIVDVPEGTPAALADLRPGDVVTHIGDAAVGTVEALRAGVARAHGPLVVRLVRQGQSRQLLLGG